ncbi:hypothetical protein [Actinopolymorpha alba]|uniref:hypothetical protein n=1 Tax=Actinopolymorpha alba TaxID=533267 RepID=UPI00035E149D|nr:hypothetical protein [Actinopolymorpha alba]
MTLFGKSSDRQRVVITYKDGRRTVHKSVPASEVRRVEKEFEWNKEIAVIKVTPEK